MATLSASSAKLQLDFAETQFCVVYVGALSQMRTSLRSRLYWLGLGIGLFFFAGQILRGYQVFSTLTLDVALLVRLSAAVLAGLVALGLQMAAWRYLMQDLGVKLTWRSIIGGYMLSFLPRYVPGSVWGYLSRSEWLKTSYGVPYVLSSIGSALEISAALITGSAVIGFYYLLSATGLVQLALLCFEVIFPVLSWFILNSVFQFGYLKKRVDLQGWHGSRRVNFVVWSKIFVLYIMLWLCYGALTLILVGEFSPSSATPSLVAATFSFCVSWLIGFLLVFFPAGLGVREIALSNIMVNTMGISIGVASTISVLTRLCIAAAEALWVSIGLVIQRKRKKAVGIQRSS
jgi:glycosyltransferase 2 family protein